MSRILVIDSDPGMVNWIRIVLRGSKMGCRITTTSTGREAFRLLNSEDFDLCILEYALPDMTGVQFCTLLRQMGCRVPMMFFSAMDRPVDRERAIRAGADAYLSKPEDLDVFPTTVQRLLRGDPQVIGTRIVQLPRAARAAH